MKAFEDFVNDFTDKDYNDWIENTATRRQRDKALGIREIKLRTFIEVEKITIEQDLIDIFTKLLAKDELPERGGAAAIAKKYGFNANTVRGRLSEFRRGLI